MEQRQERHDEDGEKTTKTQEPRNHSSGDQRSSDRFLFQLLHSTGGYVALIFGDSEDDGRAACSLVPEDADAELEDSDEMRSLAADFEIGHMLRDSIIPKAVLYYTGEAGDEDDDDVRERTEARRTRDEIFAF